jgi:hypothetical protein
MPGTLQIGAPEYAPGTDQFGGMPRGGGGMDFAGQLPSWSPDALSSHVQGYQMAAQKATSAHNRRVMEAGRLLSDVVSGRLDPIFWQAALNPGRANPYIVQALRESYPAIYRDGRGRQLTLQETMAVTDYQALYADVIDRLYYSNFAAWPITNMDVVKSADLRDFRTVKRYMYDGLVTPYTGSDPGAPPPQQAMLGPAPQNGAIPPTPATSTAAVTYSPLLYQASASINWAAFVGDDLGIFKDVPKRLAIKGNRGIAKFITQQYCDINGPNTSAALPLFQSGFRNQLIAANGASATNPRLSIQAIVDAYTILAGQLDATGDPIMIGGKISLVYGASDYGTAKNLANMLDVMVSNQGGVAGTSANLIGQLVRVKNWAMENLTLVYDPYLTLVATNNPHSWFLVCDPMSQERPGVEVGFLTGFKEPQLFTEIPTTQRMGGGPDPTMGNFWSNNQNIKIMGVMGASAIDGRSWVGSNGSGS